MNFSTPRHPVTFIVLFKAVVGCSVAMLALAGVAVPHLGGIDPVVLKAAGAALGAVIGAAVALRG